MKKVFLFLVFLSSILFADATIEIVKRVDRLPVIQVQDSSEESLDSNIRDKFFKVLIADLKVTTFFDVIDTHTKASYTHGYKSDTINNLTADIILRYKLYSQEDNTSNLMVSVKYINPRSNSLIAEKKFKISKSINYPFLAHNTIIDLSKTLKVGNVDWMDKYIIFSRYVSSAESEIVLADYTLTFQKVLVKGGLNIFPKWANKNQDSFFYTSYNLEKPTLYLVNLESGERNQIISGSGMLVASDVSKNGNKILLTMAPDDQPDIYLYDMSNKQLKNITNYRGIDIGGNFVEDESQIVFVSDRLGYPNVFLKNINDNKAIEQLVYHGRNNAAASAFKNYIVYSSRDKASEFGEQTFNLYLISTKTDYIRQLTATGKNLYPRFSHDGESIIFIKEFAKDSAVGIIRLGANKSFHFPLKAGKIQSIDW